MGSPLSIRCIPMTMVHKIRPRGAVPSMSMSMRLGMKNGRSALGLAVPGSEIIATSLSLSHLEDLTLERTFNLGLCSNTHT